MANNENNEQNTHKEFNNLGIKEYKKGQGRGESGIRAQKMEKKQQQTERIRNKGQGAAPKECGTRTKQKAKKGRVKDEAKI